MEGHSHNRHTSHHGGPGPTMGTLSWGVDPHAFVAGPFRPEAFQTGPTVYHPPHRPGGAGSDPDARGLRGGRPPAGPPGGKPAASLILTFDDEERPRTRPCERRHSDGLCWAGAPSDAGTETHGPAPPAFVLSHPAGGSGPFRHPPQLPSLAFPGPPPLALAPAGPWEGGPWARSLASSACPSGARTPVGDFAALHVSAAGPGPAHRPSASTHCNTRSGSQDGTGGPLGAGGALAEMQARLWEEKVIPGPTPAATTPRAAPSRDPRLAEPPPPTLH